MAAIYLDTSAIVKRYIHEDGTNWIINLTSYATGHDLYIVRLAGPEMSAALFRKARRGQVSVADAVKAASSFRVDWQQQYRIIESGPYVCDLAMDLAERYTLRGYDAVQLAAAIVLQQARQASQLSALTFVSADVEQLNTARAEGLMVENPDNYA
jgi:predicted nucleic acid-binding protein